MPWPPYPRSRYLHLLPHHNFHLLLHHNSHTLLHPDPYPTMKVLLIGATGKLGLRLIASLLSHNHTISAFVRSRSKLSSLLPPSTLHLLTVIEGDAKDPLSIKTAILSTNADAVINTAGVAALGPWASSSLPVIFAAVLAGVRDAGVERGKPLRAWFMGGFSVLCYPGTETYLSDYIPIYREHRGNLQLLKHLPVGSVEWSMLCPSTMTPESEDVTVPAKASRGALIANAKTPPNWNDSWVKHIPLVGRVVCCAMNAPRYETTLEQNADFIAGDLEVCESRWRGTTVGVIDGER